MYNFEGKAAIITGAAKGIGRACALRAAKEGADVALFDLADRETGQIPVDFQEIADKIAAMGRKVMVCPTDVSCKEQVETSIRKVKEEFGKIDFLVNVAGVGWMNLLENVSEEQWNRTVDVDMKGNFLMCQAIAPIFKEQKWGRIVNIASIAGVTGGDSLFPYNAAKAGVLNLTISFAKHLGPYGVNVNGVNPGFIWTPMWTVTDRWLFEQAFPGEEYIPKKMYQGSIAGTCLRRETTVDHVANAVAFLLSDEAGEITGQHLNVDGGAEFH